MWLLPWGYTCCVYCNNNVVFALLLCSADFTQVWRVTRDSLREIPDFKQQASEKKHWLRRSDAGNDGEKFSEDEKMWNKTVYIQSAFAFQLGNFLHERDFSRSPVPSPAVGTPTRPGQTKRAHIGHSSFVAEAYSLFTWSEKQTANQLHSCHQATRRRHKLFMTLQRKGSRTRGK